MEFRNYMEELVICVLDEILARQEIGCKCQRCRLDIAALALNNLPPKYVGHGAYKIGSCENAISGRCGKRAD